MKKYFIYIILLIVFCLVAMNIYMLVNQPKIAVINIEKLLIDYDGMQDASSYFEDEKISQNLMLDSLEMEYNLRLNKYNENEISSNEKQNLEQEILAIQKYYLTLKEKVAKEADEEDLRLTQGVMEQLNVFLKRFGEENNYDLLLGSQGNGNVLFGKEKYDVTNQAIEAINTMYNE